MVDFFAVLLQPGAGDELQGIKRGLLELADALVVTKADGDQKALAQRTQSEHRQALQLLRPPYAEWKPPVLTVSSLVGEGIPEVWETVLAHREALGATGALERRRQRQARDWMWSQVQEGLERAFRADPAVARAIPGLEHEVESSRSTPAAAARRLLEAFLRSS
jgi:LAO/AO transport system kinase